MKKTLYQDLWEGAAGMEPAVALRCGDQSLTFRRLLSGDSSGGSRAAGAWRAVRGFGDHFIPEHPEAVIAF